MIIERDKIDSGIFSQLGWKGSDFKEVLLQMLDKDDMAENIGLGYSREMGSGLTLYAEGAYDLEAEDDKIGVGASFSF